ncbi:4-amino-4-deoxy-L-arabinose transferase-like glycosyltransferase [Kribbella sp. VKM Ac-2527]|uniref:4-amino-4-deoxy-L-arabinose transferase-like glycosyltransferase n=1 Tax=Kribbella caucasensis TaxID=2512215 RepID=A0A4V3C9Y5_9ACTN|nr:glycosyltransferase family 39 protein [Kribbella sp. VKM Ac-2527]TDO47777.1 4-amino-4-deoxy-L-arabinose transferase-like glycosyltransferase [Kribbella sp. VKM Ac-2527]
MTRPPVPAFAIVPVAAIALTVAAVLTALSGRYGYHRDELYFLVAGDHLAWGYVDQPPLTPLLARISTTIFGDTPAGLRVVATLACCLTVVVVALIAREFGSERRAQILAALAAAVAGFVLGTGHMVSTATFDLLAWMLICLFAIRLLRTGDGRWWIALGLTTGIALENKYLVVLPLAALLIAVLILGPRNVLKSWWLIAGVALACLLAAPNLIWQATHDWPQLTVAGGISEDDGTENRIMFAPLQLLQLSPFLVPIWIAGFLRLWRTPTLRWARPIALAYPILCVIVLATGGKSYYALPLLLVLVAAGCQPTIDWARGARRTTLLAAGLALTAITSAIFTLPVLPTSAVNAVLPINPEQGEQIGWPELAQTVATAWNQIPADQRATAVLFAGNYGQAGALARYGPQHGLPTPYSGHMSFADWPAPPDTQTGPVLLVEQERTPRYESHFTTCTQVATFTTPAEVDNEETNTAIVLCTAPTKPWSALWPALRRYY